MAKILCSPSKYVQGAGEMKKLGEYAQKYGKKALVLITESGYKRIGDVVNTGFEGYEITPVYEYFNRECSKNEINRLVDIMNEKGCDVVIGIGGGKILDTAKAVAYYKEAPVLICPTIASTDAPCSALSVIYTDDGVFEEYLFLPANPNMVLMDTEIIAKSPVRLTVSEWVMHWQHILKQEPVRQAGQQHVPADRLHRRQSHLQNFVLTL